MDTGQTHGGKGSATRLTEKEEVYNAVNEVLRKEKLKEKSVDFSDLCAVRAIMDAAKVPTKRRGEWLMWGGSDG